MFLNNLFYTGRQLPHLPLDLCTLDYENPNLSGRQRGSEELMQPRKLLAEVPQDLVMLIFQKENSFGKKTSNSRCEHHS